MAERPRRLNRARRAPPHAPNSATACRSACPRQRATAIKAPRRRDAARARPQSVAISPSRPAAASAPALAATSVRSLSHSLPRATPACHAGAPHLRAAPARHISAQNTRGTYACHIPHTQTHAAHLCATPACQTRVPTPARPKTDAAHPRAHTRAPTPTRHSRAQHPARPNLRGTPVRHICAPRTLRAHTPRAYTCASTPRRHASQARLTTDASAPRARVSGLGGDL